MLLSFSSIWEFLLRYTVITGVLIAMAGTTLCMVAGSIQKSKRKINKIDKKDKLYINLIFIGVILILVGMIFMVLPFENTFYKG